MIIQKKYRYIGRNGIITSNVLLEDIKHILLLQLTADDGYMLTDGKSRRTTVLVEADEAELWYEIPANNKQDI